MRCFKPALLSGLLLLIFACSAQAQVFSVGTCQPSPPQHAQSGFVPLPVGELFCPFLADPKANRSFASVVNGMAEDFPSTIAAVGIGDGIGFFRWRALQLGVSANVFSQFDLAAPSFDLINADYIVGIPLTFRQNRFSGRLRVYHQSSHLGDEFLLRNQVERENLSFESIEAVLSQEIGPLRIYGGGEYLFSRNPEDLGSHVAQGGAELRPGSPFLRVGKLGSARLVGAADIKSVEEQDWKAAVSLRVGVEGNRPEEPQTSISGWQILLEYYDGPTPYGQFFRRQFSYWGIGIHLTP